MADKFPTSSACEVPPPRRAPSEAATAAAKRRFRLQQRVLFSVKRSFVLYLAVLAAFVPPGLQAYARAQQLSVSNSTLPNNQSGICKSMDIRNTLDTFKRLEGCRVVEGFVQVLLFDNVNETKLAELSFPDLTEITDYLLLYRVNGLRSVGQLFPNLAVIRGENLFLHEYAFVIFEMSHLQEISLYSLQDITKGLVRIDKNPSLCFVRSIDWAKICHEKGEHYIYNIKPDNECPICPGPGGKKEYDHEGNEIKACPNSTDPSYIDVPYGHLCWNRQHCQKICPENCLSCNEKGECCNSLCIGGCAPDDVNACVACRNYSMGFGNERKCMRDCPPGFYKYLGRCVTFRECVEMAKPPDLYPNNESDFPNKPFKVFNDSCILHCSPEYTNDYENHTCIPCQGRCRKECPGINVDSITVALQLKGCTVIKGSLEIQIRAGSNVVNQLEENLGMIEEIHGYLKIVRSFPLVSLNFFKSLKRIKGESLESSKYVFVVLDNQNLQELWEDWSNRSFRIERGSLFFHFNPKLCINKIEMLRNKTGLQPFSDLEVAKNSNGDKIACNVSELKVNVTLITSKGVVLVWRPFELDGDERQLLGYIVYSIEAPYRNVTVYDGRDACGVDDWRVDDVAKNDEKITHPLLKLKPYTQYAYYVKTYTVATERNGAQSKIKYFRTLPSMPTPPQIVQAVSYNYDSLKITWTPPHQPNGNITYYIVAGKKNANENMDSKDRDYCEDPPTEIKVVPKETQTAKTTKLNNDTCVCPDSSKPTKSKTIDETKEIARIKFENELQNIVYIKRLAQTRRKRDLNEDLLIEGSQKTFKEIVQQVKFEHDIHNALFEDKSPHSRSKRDVDKSFPNTTENPKNTVNKINNVTENGTEIWESFSFNVYGKSEFYINKLHHYTNYDITVQACREAIENDTESLCSLSSVTTSRTLKKTDADNIKNLRVSNQTEDTVTLKWDQPEHPNGVIYSYSIEYYRIKKDSQVASTGSYRDCVTHKKLKKFDRTMVYTLRENLPQGNYSLTIKVRSSAGEVSQSEKVYFLVEESSGSIVYIFVFLILFLLIAGLITWIVWRRHVKDTKAKILNPYVNPEYVSSKYVQDEWEVPREKIKLIRELGQGSFGMVWEGEASDIRGKAYVRCAVKTVNEHATNSERMEFLNEASVMKAFDTAHVVRLLGVVSQGQPTLVIMELMTNEDLKSYLRSHRLDSDNSNPNHRKQPPTLKQIYQMAIEISDGMAYLSAKKYVHRDLAARNCMVSENLTVKIGDFGMTRDVYETDYYRKGTKGLLPVRWMAPESLRDGVFSSHSDTWSYGVVLWEMATLASQPYQGLANDQVLRYVIDGGVMERPENCPDKLYGLMRMCWHPLASERPSFLKLCSLLLEDASPVFPQVSFYHSAAGIEARTSHPLPSSSILDDQTTPLRSSENDSESEEKEEEEEEEDSEQEIPTTRISFPTANGFGCPTNGAATTQC
ncbi:unnamed protein product [Brassicogethes aeneus]|uniref:Tyrosine-protein kinase receptor n=1 Tax=Brassicogethes aeneus TaxID=1431903 RepID=A0A9P0FLZ5_BRAAE|nr:unnamed protein product [Brassicogethes aeneus]